MEARVLLAVFFLLCAVVLWGSEDAVGGQEPTTALVDDIQELKLKTLELNRDLFILEEELLYPSDSQLSVFVSLDVGEFFTLDAVKLSIDGELKTHYLYTERQVDALRRGGVQRLFMGNIKAGEHELVAVFTGSGPRERDYRRATQLRFEKVAGATRLELKIVDLEAQQQPDFQVKQW
jgi:hypothetical protein